MNSDFKDDYFCKNIIQAILFNEIIICFYKDKASKENLINSDL